jgi:hypothetical protein
MRYISILTFISLLSSCSSSPSDEKKEPPRKDPFMVADPRLKEEPALTVLDFLEWYRKNMMNIGKAPMIDTKAFKKGDTTHYYTVNFEGTEKYLAEIKASGFVSEKYLESQRKDFKRSDDSLHAHPANDGPPYGFDYDLVMLSQDLDEDLSHLDQAKLSKEKVTDHGIFITLEFISGMKLEYTLTRGVDTGKWWIDEIKNGAVNNSL